MTLQETLWHSIFMFHYKREIEADKTRDGAFNIAKDAARWVEHEWMEYGPVIIPDLTPVVITNGSNWDNKIWSVGPVQISGDSSE